MTRPFKQVALTFCLLVLALAACNTPPIEADVATLAPLPTATTMMATNTLAPTVEPTLAVTVTPEVPHPITWTVEETTTPDGRTIYAVNDPAVVQAAQQGYERLREYYRFPDGLPAKEQLMTDLAQFILDPDRLRGAVDQLEKTRDAGGYWIQPPVSIYQWADKAEFNADGSQVSLTMTADTYHADFFSLKAGKITYSQEDKGFMAEVTMAYDPLTGVWKVLAEKTSTAEKGSVVTVTPSP